MSPIPKPIIAIDIDDVIADTHETMRHWGNQVSGAVLTVEDLKVPGDYWGYYDRVWETHNLQHALNHEDFEDAILMDRVSVPVLAGASFAIKQLQDKYKIVLITSRYIELETITRKWVSEHLGEDVEIYFAKNDRAKIKGAKTKGEIAVELGVSVLVDDSVGHCSNAVEHGIDAVLFGDYGWQHSVPGEIVRCIDWPAVLEYFDGRQ